MGRRIGKAQKKYKKSLCERKEKFPTSEAALQKINELAAYDKRMGNPRTYRRAYACRDHFHITRNSSRNS